MATTRVAITPMKVAQIPKPGADFEIVERHGKLGFPPEKIPQES